MKFAFSTVACPAWDLQTVAARAKEYGYDSVELRGFLDEPVATASNVFDIPTVDVRKTFADAGVAIACLSSSLALPLEREKAQAADAQLRRYLDTAAAVGAPLVKIFDAPLRPGQTLAQTANAVTDWLLPHADYAAHCGVTLAIENALSFRTSRDLWLLLETINHPAIAAAWDVFNAAQIGEAPAVSVPALNSRIAYTQVKDARFEPRGAVFCKLGDGEVQVRKLLIRLLGIGYKGYVGLEWEKAWLKDLAEPEEMLPDAVAKMRAWIKPPESTKPVKKPVEKPAAAKAAAPTA